MNWEPELDELKLRYEMAKGRGGPEGVERQRRRGKLLVNERVDGLADPGSFREFMGLVGSGTYDDEGSIVAFTPKGSMDGFCKVDGRKIIVSAGDFTVRGGSGSGSSSGSLGRELSSNQRALQWRLPYVRMLDSAGGSVRGFEEMGRTYLPDGNVSSTIDTDLLRVVPVVSALMGSVAGLPAVAACMSHFTLMVKGISQLFPGGPPVVRQALGYDITKEDLGDERIHVHQSGSVDNLAETEEDAFRQIRQWLSYLPPNVYEMAPRIEPTDDPNRRDERLRRLVPRDPRRAYDGHKAIESIVDQGSFFEVAPFYGRARITGLARMNGYSVGIMANNPMFQGGSTDVAAGDKVIRLLQLCDMFHLPLITLADEPGFMVGLESEKRGIERAGARLVMATCESRMPWLTVVMGRVFGVAGQCQHRPTGMFQRYAWPSGRWGSMPIQGGTYAAYRREIDSAADPEAKLQEIEQRLHSVASPFRTAEATGQDIIDPADTRPLACEFVEEAQTILRTQLGPSPFPYHPQAAYPPNERTRSLGRRKGASMRILWFFPTLIAAALLVGIACSDSLPTAPAAEPPAQGTEVEQAAAKLQMWLNSVESVQLEISSTVSHEDPHGDQPTTEVTAAALITADAFYFSVQLPDNESPERPPWRYETLVQHGFAFARWQSIEGWAQRPLTIASRDIYGVIEPAGIATASWTQLADVSSERTSWDGRSVWVVEYRFGREELTRFPDLVSRIATGLNGAPTVATVLTPDSARVRLWIDRDSGAPLRIETTQVITQSGSEQVTTIASTVDLVRWNQPLAMPVPEPVVSETEFWELVGAASCPGCRPGLGDRQAWEAMELAEAWLAELRDVHYRQSTAVTLNGERRSITLEIRIAGSVGAVETDYRDSDGDGVRMIWIGDDLWLAETPDDWFRATPAQAGVGDYANAAEWLDQTFFAEHELPLSLALLKGILRAVGGSSSSDGHEEVRLEAELSGRPLADLQEIVVPAVEEQIDGLVEPTLRVESVDRLDVKVRVDPNTGRLFDATVDAAATTSAGRLELEASFEIISHDDIRIDPPATD